MINIENVLIEESIFEAKFACNLNQCKGACCTFPGEYGAPLAENEIDDLRQAQESAKKYLSPRSLKVLEYQGFYEKIENSYFTKCIDKKDCVFVFYEGQVAKCALERAYFNGENTFRKPLSCQLFPIRQGNFGGKYIYYEKISECKPAVEDGEKLQINLIDYLKEPLIRAFGKEWYEKAKNL